jgi:hypothetical protein
MTLGDGHVLKTFTEITVIPYSVTAHDDTRVRLPETVDKDTSDFCSKKIDGDGHTDLFLILVGRSCCGAQDDCV